MLRFFNVHTVLAPVLLIETQWKVKLLNEKVSTGISIKPNRIKSRKDRRRNFNKTAFQSMYVSISRSHFVRHLWLPWNTQVSKKQKDFQSLTVKAIFISLKVSWFTEDQNYLLFSFWCAFCSSNTVIKRDRTFPQELAYPWGLFW